MPEGGATRNFLVGEVVAVDEEAEEPISLHWLVPSDPKNPAESEWRRIAGGRSRRTSRVAAETVWLAFSSTEGRLPKNVVAFLREQKLL